MPHADKPDFLIVKVLARRLLLQDMSGLVKLGGAGAQGAEYVPSVTHLIIAGG